MLADSSSPPPRPPPPPWCAVLLSALFLGDKPSLPVVLTLIPIIGGVVLASTSELSFTWKGFLSGARVAGMDAQQAAGGRAASIRGRGRHMANLPPRAATHWRCLSPPPPPPPPAPAPAMGSNLTFQSRNVLSKKFMGKTGAWGGAEEAPWVAACVHATLPPPSLTQLQPTQQLIPALPCTRPPCPALPCPAPAGKGSLDNINLFSTITVVSFLLLAPMALALEGPVFTPAAMAAAGIADPWLVIQRAAVCGRLLPRLPAGTCVGGGGGVCA